MHDAPSSRQGDNCAASLRRFRAPIYPLPRDEDGEVMEGVRAGDFPDDYWDAPMDEEAALPDVSSPPRSTSRAYHSALDSPPRNTSGDALFRDGESLGKSGDKSGSIWEYLGVSLGVPRDSLGRSRGVWGQTGDKSGTI